MAKKEYQRGFTLVEILVATFIFSIVVVMAISIFGLSSNVQISTEMMRSAGQGSRYAVEQISRDIRMNGNNNTISFCLSDFDSTCSTTTIESDYLKIVSVTNSVITTKLYGLIPPDKTVLGIQTNGESWNKLSPDGFKVTKIIGSQYLFSGKPTGFSAVQPFVSIRFSLTNVGIVNKKSEEVTESIRTTVTSRNYLSLEM